MASPSLSYPLKPTEEHLALREQAAREILKFAGRATHLAALIQRSGCWVPPSDQPLETRALDEADAHRAEDNDPALFGLLALAETALDVVRSLEAEPLPGR